MSRSASIELPRTAEPEDDTSSYKLKVCGYTLNAKSRAPKANAVKQGVPIKLFACLLCKTLFFCSNDGGGVCVYIPVPRGWGSRPCTGTFSAFCKLCIWKSSTSQRACDIARIACLFCFFFGGWIICPTNK